MPQVIRISDQNNLVPADRFPSYARWTKFTEFNPVQSRVFDVYGHDANIVIAAATSAGKTVCAEMFMSYEVRERGGKACYLAPMRALAKQKLDDWTARKRAHHFSDLKLAICTGDYRLTPERKKEMDEAQLIVMTTEMLDSRTKNFASEHNEFLLSCDTVAVDEAHLLTVPGRGDKLEVGLMKFTGINPKSRIVFLSATMPNNDEIAEWLTKLTGRDTYLLESAYRPVPLGIHYEAYYDNGSYDDQEGEKVTTAASIIGDHPNDKFIVFVHTKKTGELVKRTLQKAGCACEFHNADLEGDKRHQLEDRFADDPDFKVIVATSTLAWGMNLPARRVIVTGVHRGLSEVENYDIWQEFGRAGRVGLDPRGDAYILLPESQMQQWRERIETPTPIRSRLLDYVGDEFEPHYKTLAFHLVSEVHHGAVETREGVHTWYDRSLAYHQSGDVDDDIVDSTLELLLKCGAIKEEDGKFVVTAVGRVASMFYFSPFDVSDLKRNFNAIFQNSYENNDALVAVGLGNVDTLRMGVTSRSERDEMAAFANKVQQMTGGRLRDATIKGAYAYFCLMNGVDTQSFAGFMRALQFDFSRTATVLQALDSMLCKWNKKDWIRLLEKRVRHGVRAELVDLCSVPDIGRVRAEKLFDAGLRSVEAVAKNPSTVARVLNMKADRASKICQAAEMIVLTGGS